MQFSVPALAPRNSQDAGERIAIDADEGSAFIRITSQKVFNLFEDF